MFCVCVSCVASRAANRAAVVVVEEEESVKEEVVTPYPLLRSRKKVVAEAVATKMNWTTPATRATIRSRTLIGGPAMQGRLRVAIPRGQSSSTLWMTNMWWGRWHRVPPQCITIITLHRRRPLHGTNNNNISNINLLAPRITRPIIIISSSRLANVSAINSCECTRKLLTEETQPVSLFLSPYCSLSLLVLYFSMSALKMLSPRTDEEILVFLLSQPPNILKEKPLVIILNKSFSLSYQIHPLLSNTLFDVLQCSKCN